MKLYGEVIALLKKDMMLEWRQKYAINGVLLYVICTVFIIYISFSHLSPNVWMTLFWIIMLFTSVNAIAKSFLQEGRNRWLYYYLVVNPQAVILSKMIYNTLLMLLLSVISFFFYSIVTGNPVQDITLFFTSVILGAIGFSFAFTLISSIVSKTNNNITLMAILSFPIIIPLLLLLISLSKEALISQKSPEVSDEILTLLALDVIMMFTALLLFPYIWRD